MTFQKPEKLAKARFSLFISIPGKTKSSSVWNNSKRAEITVKKIKCMLAILFSHSPKLQLFSLSPDANTSAVFHIQRAILKATSVQAYQKQTWMFLKKKYFTLRNM